MFLMSPFYPIISKLFPTFGFQIITELRSLEDLPRSGSDKLRLPHIAALRLELQIIFYEITAVPRVLIKFCQTVPKSPGKPVAIPRFSTLGTALGQVGLESRRGRVTRPAPPRGCKPVTSVTTLPINTLHGKKAVTTAVTTLTVPVTKAKSVQILLALYGEHANLFPLFGIICIFNTPSAPL